MILRSTSSKIVITTATSADVDYHFTYSDLTTEATDGSSQGKITTATDTDAVAAPSASTSRIVLEGLITNIDSTTQTVTVSIDISGTKYRLYKTSLAAGETLQYVKGVGFVVQTIVNVTGGGGTDLTPVIHNTDTDIVATKNTAIYIPSGTFTGTKTIDISALDTDGDRLEIYNHDSSGNLRWADGTEVYVYEAMINLVETPTIPTGSVKIIRIDNKNLT